MSKALIDFVIRLKKFALGGLLSFYFFHSQAQDSTRFSLAGILIYQPTDFYGAVSFQDKHRFWFQEGQLGIGVRNSIFQQRFNPRLAYCVGIPIQISKFYLQPHIQFAYNIMNLQVPTKHNAIQGLDLTMVVRIGFGIKNGIFLGAGLGPAWELKYNEFTERKAAYFYWTYFAQIGFRHAL